MDPVNPEHYKSNPTGVETIHVTRHMSFVLGNALKYCERAGKKTTDPTECYRKALWYVHYQLQEPRAWRKVLRPRRNPPTVALYLSATTAPARWLWEADRYDDRDALRLAENWLKARLRVAPES